MTFSSRFRSIPILHDREIRLSSGWTVKIGRGFDIYQRPDDWLNIGANDLDLRPCLETTVDVFPSSAKGVAEDYPILRVISPVVCPSIWVTWHCYL